MRDLLARGHVPPQLVGEVFEEDHVIPRVLRFGRAGGNLLAIGAASIITKNRLIPILEFWISR